MNKLIEGVKAFLAEEEGLTIVEYAVGGALVAAVTVTAFSDLGTTVCNKIDELADVVGGEGAANC